MRESRYRSQENTPVNSTISLTDLTVGTVEVVDLAHPLYGRTFPLVSVTNKRRVGPACVIWLETGVERIVPLAATNLAPRSPEPPPVCRLSASSARNLLAVLASISDVYPPDAEEAHANTETGASEQPPTAHPAAGDVPGRGGDVSERLSGERRGALGIPAAQSRPPLTCEPSGVWKTLEEADRERVKSSWARTMREVADDASDQ